MPDIMMTRIAGTTRHFRALIDVDPANLQPSIDLFEYLDPDGATLRRMPAGSLQGPNVEATIKASFEAKTTSLVDCEFLADSLDRTYAPNPGWAQGGSLTGASIKLDITTNAIAVEADAIEMQF